MLTAKRISGIPVVERWAAGGSSPTDDVRFAGNPTAGRELMTRTIGHSPLGTGQKKAEPILHQRRIEKCWGRRANHCVGDPVKDIEKSVAAPFATKDSEGGGWRAPPRRPSAKRLRRPRRDLTRLRRTSSTRARPNLDRRGGGKAGVKSLSNSSGVAGNMPPLAAKALIDAGADAIKVGIGPDDLHHPIVADSACRRTHSCRWRSGEERRAVIADAVFP